MNNPLETIIIIALLLIALAAIIKKDDDNKKIKTKEQAILPYRKRYLLTKTEYAFYGALKEICDNNNLLICPKVRLEDLAEVTTKQNYMKYRGYIKSRHVDFTLCDKDLNVIASIELDDYSHNTKKAKQTDSFKNQLFLTIGIPLFRIIVCNNYTEQLQQMFKQLNLNIATTNNLEPNNKPYTNENLEINDILKKQNDLLITQNTMLQELLKQNKSANNS